MVPSAYERLAARFPTEAHKKVNKGGRDQTYIPWTDKVERLNEVLGSDWSFRIVREGMTETEAWVLAEIETTIDGVRSVRQHYGCEAITRGQAAKPVTDLFKIAASDALSKAATLFGCGLYLSIQEERAEVEAAMQEAVRAALAEKRAGSKPAPTTTETVRASAVITGAPPQPETTQDRWARLVAQAEQVKLPTLGQVKAIDPNAISEPQLRNYADLLEARLREVRAA